QNRRKASRADISLPFLVPKKGAGARRTQAPAPHHRPPEERSAGLARTVLRSRLLRGRLVAVRLRGGVGRRLCGCPFRLLLLSLGPLPKSTVSAAPAAVFPL